VADCHAKIGSVLNQAGLLNWLIPFLTYALRIARFTVGVKKTLRYSNVFFYNRTTKEERDAVYHAIHVSYAVMIAAAYALVKNPATVKNIRKGGNHESP
jgi:hypothetical protein